MAFRSITRNMLDAYERECSGLNCLERGALWSLTALAHCRWAGEDGLVRAEVEALRVELGVTGPMDELLKGLQCKGKIRIMNEEDGRVELKVCFWYDRWFKDRQYRMNNYMQKKVGRVS